MDRLEVARSPDHCPLSALWSFRRHFTEEIVKQTRKTKSLPAHQLSLVGRGFLAHPAGQETRHTGYVVLPDPQHDTILCTPMIWAVVYELWKNSKKHHLTKPTVTEKVIESKQHS